MNDDIFPITDQEAAALHADGWSSGYGWQTEYDWFREQSFGPPIWVEDDPVYKHKFVTDLAVIRSVAEKKRMLAVLGTAGPELLAAAEEARAVLQTIGHSGHAGAVYASDHAAALLDSAIQSTEKALKEAKP